MKITITVDLTESRRGVCPRCGSTLPTPGFHVHDDQAVQQFICTVHLTEMLNALATPQRGDRRRPKLRFDGPQGFRPKLRGFGEAERDRGFSGPDA